MLKQEPWTGDARSHFTMLERRRMFDATSSDQEGPIFLLGFHLVNQPHAEDNGPQIPEAGRLAFATKLASGAAWSDCLGAASPWISNALRGKVDYVYNAQRSLETQALEYFSRVPTWPAAQEVSGQLNQGRSYPYAFSVNLGTGFGVRDFYFGGHQNVNAGWVETFCRSIGLSSASAKAAGIAAAKRASSSRLANMIKPQATSAHALAGLMFQNKIKKPTATTKPAIAPRYYARGTPPPQPVEPSRAAQLGAALLVNGVAAGIGGAAGYYVGGRSTGWALGGAAGAVLALNVVALVL